MSRIQLAVQNYSEDAFVIINSCWGFLKSTTENFSSNLYDSQNAFVSEADESILEKSEREPIKQKCQKQNMPNNKNRDLRYVMENKFKIELH